MPETPTLLAMERDNSMFDCNDATIATPASRSVMDQNNSIVGKGFSCTDTSILDNMARVTTIQDSELLRGVDLRAVMRGFGAVLQSSHTRPGERSYQLSHVVTSIDEFISHTWSTGRTVKFLALALHYHASSATFVAWTTGAICSGLTLAGAIPLFAPSWTDGTSLTATIAGHIAFVLALCYGQDLRRLLCPCWPSKQRYVFLDKVCIHQQDIDVQRESIRSLAGILRVSQTLLVLYSNRYLHRLWTVYEVASFLSLHQDTSRIVLLPTWWPPRLAILMVLFGLSSVLVHLSSVNAMLLYLILFVINLFLATLFFRQWDRHLHSIQRTIEQFSIREAACTVEADRSLVEANVKTFMQCLGRVPPEATEEAALDAFDTMVKEELPSSILASFGRNAFPYKLQIAITMTYMLRALDQATSAFIAGDLRVGLARFVYRGSIPFSFVPLCIYVSQRLARTNLQLSGVAELLYVLVLILFALVSLLYWSLSMLLLGLSERLEGRLGWLAFLGLICYQLMLAACGAWLFSGGTTLSPKEPSVAASAETQASRTRSKEPLCFDETEGSFSL